MMEHLLKKMLPFHKKTFLHMIEYTLERRTLRKQNKKAISSEAKDGLLCPWNVQRLELESQQ
jgi:hypothetical protein